VIRIFPNEDSAIRLIGALLVEQDERWASGKKYFDMTDYYDFMNHRQLIRNIVAA
ncbi:MAG: transposase, partial [Eubacteriaceae bacterium]|nr:transposase [Eubacteriaceae bacterium]